MNFLVILFFEVDSTSDNIQAVIAVHKRQWFRAHTGDKGEIEEAGQSPVGGGSCDNGHPKC